MQQRVFVAIRSQSNNEHIYKSFRTAGDSLLFGLSISVPICLSICLDYKLPNQMNYFCNEIYIYESAGKKRQTPQSLSGSCSLHVSGSSWFLNIGAKNTPRTWRHIIGWALTPHMSRQVRCMDTLKSNTVLAFLALKCQCNIFDPESQNKISLLTSQSFEHNEIIFFLLETS